MTYEHLQLTPIDEFILQVNLHRPEIFNAINSVLMQELLDLWQSLQSPSVPWRCIILTGSGPAFCAGADLKERYGMDPATWQAKKYYLEQAMLTMLNCPIPIIAAVNGAAYGGGLELVLAADFAYAADNATFAQSEVKVGLIPGALGTQHLPQACGLRRAKELALTAATFSALQAWQWGIINKVIPGITLLEEVIKTAQTICLNAPLAVFQVKKSMNFFGQKDIKSGFAFERAAYNLILPSADRKEGVDAFNEKRQPKFIGK